MTKNDNLMGIVAVILLKGGAAICSFLMFSLMSNTRSAEEFGSFAIVWSAASMMMVLAAFGQEMMVIKAWNEHSAAKAPGKVKGGILIGFFTCLIGGVIGGSALGIFYWITQSAFLGLVVGLFVLTLTMLAFSAHLGRAVLGVMISDGTRDVLKFIPAILLLAASMMFIGGLSNAEVFLIVTVTITLGSIGLLTLVYFKLKQEFPEVLEAEAVVDFKEWWSTTVSLWGASLLESSNQYMDVVLLGFLLNPAAVGVYFVATRLANVFLTAASAMHSFGSKRIPHHYYHKHDGELASTLKMMAGMVSLIVTCGLLCAVTFGHWALGIFGAEYVDYYDILLILCIGTASITAAGAAPVILMVTGFEKNYLKSLSISVATRLSGFILLVPFFGIYGAALAATFSQILMALMLAKNAKRLTGLDGTVLRVLSEVPLMRKRSVS
ncbi:MAG: polysaccharide biosynthesis C-terminal domain-containing protein [Hyphomicrobiales bacterium]